MCRAAVAGALAALWVVAPFAKALQVTSAAGWRTVTLDEYRQHLQQLEGVVTDCGAQQTLKSAAPADDSACDPKRVGPDDRVEWGAGSGAQTREVRYDWMRAALARAAKRNSSPQPQSIGSIVARKSTLPTIEQVLAEARQRLKDDEEQAGGTAEANPNYAAERNSLQTILAQKAYQGVSEMSPRERLVEWVDNLLDRFFASLVRLGSRAPWLGWVLRILLLGGIGIALVWFLIRIERNARVRLVPDAAPAPGAPSAREWQLWYQDAAAAAAKQEWREAIHFLYWAAISLLESRRMWPADRARTPREYLALLAGGDPRKTSLTELTRRFERTWYGGRESAASDFQAALELVRALGLEVRAQ